MGSADGLSAEAGKAGAGPVSGGGTIPRAIILEIEAVHGMADAIYRLVLHVMAQNRCRAGTNAPKIDWAGIDILSARARTHAEVVISHGPIRS